MRKPTLTAISWLLLSVPVLAGYDAGAWPSTNHYTYSNAAAMSLVSNLYAQSHTETWTQSSSTNYIPVITNDLWGHTGPIGGAATNARTWVMQYLTDISADASTGTVASWDEATTTQTAAIVASGVTVTTTLVHAYAGVQTNLRLNVRDVWGWDGYMALQERWKILEPHGGATDQRQDFTNAVKPRFYRDTRANLVGLKGWIEDNAASFVDKGHATGGTYTNYAVQVPAYQIPMLTATRAVTNAGAPANWYDWTPYRDLGGWTPGEGHIVTSTFTIAASSGATVTNDVLDYCGGSHTISGTNGQQFSFACTNANVAEGYTDRHYTYALLTNVIHQLDWTVRDFDLSVSNDYVAVVNIHSNRGDATSVWDNSDSVLYTNVAADWTNNVTTWSDGEWNAATPFFYSVFTDEHPGTFKDRHYAVQRNLFQFGLGDCNTNRPSELVWYAQTALYVDGGYDEIWSEHVVVGTNDWTDYVRMDEDVTLWLLNVGGQAPTVPATTNRVMDGLVGDFQSCPVETLVILTNLTGASDIDALALRVDVIQVLHKWAWFYP